MTTASVVLTLQRDQPYWFVNHDCIYVEHWSASDTDFKRMGSGNFFVSREQAVQYLRWYTEHCNRLMEGLINA